MESSSSAGWKKRTVGLGNNLHRSPYQPQILATASQELSEEFGVGFGYAEWRIAKNTHFAEETRPIPAPMALGQAASLFPTKKNEKAKARIRRKSNITPFRFLTNKTRTVLRKTLAENVITA